MPKRAPTKQARPKLPKASEQMKAWSAALLAEVEEWPQVSARAFFGFFALYRRDQFFAALPRTRAMGTPDSLIFKLDSPTTRVSSRLTTDCRVGETQMRKARWFTFELTEETDLRGAVDWLARAYEAAGRRRGRV